MNTKQTGDYGETIAVEHLKAHGYIVETTNWRCPGGEIDIVATQGKTLAFIEVRTRHAKSSEAAFTSITPRKRETMIRTAYRYCAENAVPDKTPTRIDVIAVTLHPHAPPTITHMEDALGW